MEEKDIKKWNKRVKILKWVGIMEVVCTIRLIICTLISKEVSMFSYICSLITQCLLWALFAFIAGKATISAKEN